MSIFLDTSDIELIKKYHEMGIIRGVTTNPTILLKNDVAKDKGHIKNLMIEIADVISPFPLSVELTTNDATKMIKQAIDISELSRNIVIKVPIHGPNGEIDNLKIVHTLEKEYNIRVNVTAMMNAQQGIVAALAGASYISIFGGRTNDMGYNCNAEINKLRKILDISDIKSKIIVGSTREVLNIIEWLEAGAHFVTTTPKLLNGMIIHPRSMETIRMFLTDAKKIEI